MVTAVGKQEGIKRNLVLELNHVETSNGNQCVTVIGMMLEKVNNSVVEPADVQQNLYLGMSIELELELLEPLEYCKSVTGTINVDHCSYDVKC